MTIDIKTVSELEAERQAAEAARTALAERDQTWRAMTVQAFIDAYGREPLDQLDVPKLTEIYAEVATRQLN